LWVIQKSPAGFFRRAIFLFAGKIFCG
jgi:hypothetical protein